MDRILFINKTFNIFIMTIFYFFEVCYLTSFFGLPYLESSGCMTFVFYCFWGCFICSHRNKIYKKHAYAYKLHTLACIHSLSLTHMHFCIHKLISNLPSLSLSLSICHFSLQSIDLRQHFTFIYFLSYTLKNAQNYLTVYCTHGFTNLGL